MKKLVLASAVAMTLGASAAYAGDIIQINPDAAGVDPILSVGTMDWAPGNAVSIGVGSPDLLAAAYQNQTAFQTYAHAALGGFLDGNGNTIGGINLNGPTAATNYEWTYATGFLEIVSTLAGAFPNQQAQFQTVAGGDNFFKIYYDATPDSNNLTGAGFNDGILILSGTVLPFDLASGDGGSSFNTTGGCVPTPAGLACGDLDTFGTNNYPLIDTPTGNGSANLAVDVTFADPNFFLSGINLLLISFDTHQNLPYDQQNPSACFHDGTGAQVNGAGGQGTTCTNSVGAVNGLSGPNVMFMTDANSSAVVPEPATVALLGLGLIGLGLARRRKTQA